MPKFVARVIFNAKWDINQFWKLSIHVYGGVGHKVKGKNRPMREKYYLMSNVPYLPDCGKEKRKKRKETMWYTLWMFFFITDI